MPFGFELLFLRLVGTFLLRLMVGTQSHRRQQQLFCSDKAKLEWHFDLLVKHQHFTFFSLAPLGVLAHPDLQKLLTHSFLS